MSKSHKVEDINTATVNNFKQWLSPSELALEYGIGKDCQAKYRMARKIPFHKFGGFIRYSKSEIDNWISEHKVKMITK